MNVQERLEEAGFEIPDVAAPVASYVPAVRSGNLVFTSGQLPVVNDRLLSSGKVGGEVSMEEARRCAERCALNALAAVASVAGSLDAVSRVVKIAVFVASTPDFSSQPEIANGASGVLAVAFGPHGAHARTAVGVSVLPLDAPVEVELVVELAH